MKEEKALHILNAKSKYWNGATSKKKKIGNKKNSGKKQKLVNKKKAIMHMDGNGNYY